MPPGEKLNVRDIESKPESYNLALKSGEVVEEFTCMSASQMDAQSLVPQPQPQTFKLYTYINEIKLFPSFNISQESWWYLKLHGNVHCCILFCHITCRSPHQIHHAIDVWNFQLYMDFSHNLTKYFLFAFKINVWIHQQISFTLADDLRHYLLPCSGP